MRLAKVFNCNLKVVMTVGDEVVDGPEFPVAKVGPAYQQLADHLLELIVSGTLKPGDRLPSEAELSANFAVSRSTVREALRLLTSRDLLATTRGATGGTFVARVRPGQFSDYLETTIGLLSSDGMAVDEILEARELLEVPAAGLAAERRSAEDLDTMEQALLQEESLLADGGHFREHRRFHTVVIRAAGNRLLDLMTAPVFGVLQGRFLRPDIDKLFWSDVESDHRDIAALIRAGDARGAEHAMAAHLGRLREAYQR